MGKDRILGPAVWMHLKLSCNKPVVVNEDTDHDGLPFRTKLPQTPSRVRKDHILNQQKINWGLNSTFAARMISCNEI